MSEIWIMIAVMGATGALAGFGAGLLGIGGGAVMVPGLYYAFHYMGVDPALMTHCAVATSAAVIIVNSSRALATHYRLGNVEGALLWPKNILKSYALWIGIGAFIASVFIAPKLSSLQLTLTFAILTFVMSLQFIFGRPSWRLRDNVPGGVIRPVIGSVIGGLSGLIGIGGGSLSVPLMSMCAVPMRKAIGTASGFGLAIGLPAALGFIISGWSVPNRPDFSLGYVNVPAFISLVLAAFICVPLGAHLANRLPQAQLKCIFGICLMCVAGNMMFKSLSG